MLIAMPGPASSVEDHLLRNLFLSSDCGSNLPEIQVFFRSPMHYMPDSEASKYVGKNLATSQIGTPKSLSSINQPLSKREHSPENWFYEACA